MHVWDTVSFWAAEWSKEADTHSFTHTNTEQISERGWRIHADAAVFKRITSLTHFTAQRSRATSDPTIPESVRVCTWQRNPLLFAVSLSSVPGFLPHCSAVSDLLQGGMHSSLLICGGVLNGHLSDLIVLPWMLLSKEPRKGGNGVTLPYIGEQYSLNILKYLPDDTAEV